MNDIDRQNLEHRRMKSRLLELGEIFEDNDGDIYWKSTGQKLGVETKEELIQRIRKKHCLNEF